MGKVIYMQEPKESQDRQGKKNTTSTLGDKYNEICKSIVLGVLEKGEKPTRDYVTQKFEQHLQQHNIKPSSVQADIWEDISKIFSTELSHDDIKLLANMYGDMCPDKFGHSEFFVNFTQTHDTNQELLDNTLDSITLLLDRMTVRQLMLGTNQQLLYTLSQTEVPGQIKGDISTPHPVITHYRKKEGQKKSSRGSGKMAA